MTNTNTIVSSPSTSPLTVSEAQAQARTLTPVDLAALAALLTSRNSEIAPGTHHTSGTISWSAVVEKLEDETNVKALGFDYTAAFLLLANHVNRSTLSSVLAELAQHHTNDTKPDTKAMKKWVSDEWDRFGLTVSGTRSGKTLVKGSVRVG